VTLGCSLSARPGGHSPLPKFLTDWTEIFLPTRQPKSQHLSTHGTCGTRWHTFASVLFATPTRPGMMTPVANSLASLLCRLCPSSSLTVATRWGLWDTDDSVKKRSSRALCHPDRVRRNGPVICPSLSGRSGDRTVPGADESVAEIMVDDDKVHGVQATVEGCLRRNEKCRQRARHHRRFWSRGCRRCACHL